MGKNIVIFLIGYLSLFSAFAQTKQIDSKQYTTHNKGKFFLYWGGNRGYYSKSDIQFKGNHYNFTLSDVSAIDKPKGWHIDYINYPPNKRTNRVLHKRPLFRIGWS